MTLDDLSQLACCTERLASANKSAARTLTVIIADNLRSTHKLQRLRAIRKRWVSIEHSLATSCHPPTQLQLLGFVHWPDTRVKNFLDRLFCKKWKERNCWFCGKSVLGLQVKTFPSFLCLLSGEDKFPFRCQCRSPQDWFTGSGQVATRLSILSRVLLRREFSFGLTDCGKLFLVSFFFLFILRCCLFFSLFVQSLPNRDEICKVEKWVGLRSNLLWKIRWLLRQKIKRREEKCKRRERKRERASRADSESNATLTHDQSVTDFYQELPPLYCLNSFQQTYPNSTFLINENFFFHWVPRGLPVSTGESIKGDLYSWRNSHGFLDNKNYANFISSWLFFDIFFITLFVGLLLFFFIFVRWNKRRKENLMFDMALK